MRKGAQNAIYCAVICFILVISISFFLAQWEGNNEFRYKEKPDYCECFLSIPNGCLYLVTYGTI